MVLTERYCQILEYIQEKKAVTVQQLCKELYASPATIRRDLTTLEKYHLIHRVHGGAILYESGNTEPASSIRQTKNITVKKRIGDLASVLVKDYSTVFLDCSTTVYYAAMSLTQMQKLTVVTNGLSCAQFLSQQTDWDIFFPSGKVESQMGSTTGSDTILALSKFYADFAIISCTGLIPDGITEASVDQSRYKLAMLENSQTRILLCDSTKFGSRYFSRTCGFDYIDYLVTDIKPPPEYVELFEKNNCQIIYPEEDE
ncbi:DeoR/GlpR family DNA-binding transcription regulator [Lachnospiraceae bacterium ASD4241]|uniref:DeoR/GlpR family DNA-binding transcription regulator n=1 Tax=Diplocloster modestus TaxID=2850322 RepID=A0ABS6KDY9_9FIRM|nr:DeoR/GlpR family DNA-binding transcription regulator [Diplocloster modestus]